MNNINIYYGSDSQFDIAISKIDSYHTIGELLNHIDKKKSVVNILLEVSQKSEEPPLSIKNLVMFTDDYGAVSEWAIMGFSNNVLNHRSVTIENIWLNNPPTKIYEDVKKTFPDNIKSNPPSYQNQNITTDILSNISKDYTSVIIGQDHAIKQILSALYSLKNQKRKKPVSILFLGDSGVGKTETAKYINGFLLGQMVRVQFSMQQTNEAYKYIFGANHGEDSLARELIRRESNLILFDEFDKVQPSFFNAFYQMFDEGEFVDANYSVNVEKCIIICTTNYLSEKEAETKLGAPIFSRFSKIITFNPISVENKIKIAENNYQEIYNQLDDEDKSFISNNKILDFYKANITKGYYKNMRMLKNDIEDSINFEILKARKIIT